MTHGHMVCLQQLNFQATVSAVEERGTGSQRIKCLASQKLYLVHETSYAGIQSNTSFRPEHEGRTEAQNSL